MTYYIIEKERQANYGMKIMGKTYSKNLAFEEAEYYKEKYGKNYIVVQETEKLAVNVSACEQINR